MAMNDPSPKDDVISKVQAGGTHLTPHKVFPRTGKCVKKILLHLALLTVGMATVVTVERPVPTSTGVEGWGRRHDLSAPSRPNNVTWN